MAYDRDRARVNALLSLPRCCIADAVNEWRNVQRQSGRGLALMNSASKAGKMAAEFTDAEVEAAIRSVPTHHAPTPQLVELSKLIPPSSRPIADPGKLARHGPFDWNKYVPIIVETDGQRLWLMDGMTRVENARRAGITQLPASIYRR